ncbi:MAG: agmatinase [Armatimonadota bacterium]
MPFLASRPHRQPSAVIIGAPYDATATYRPGAAAAPEAIRRASESIETYSPIQRRDLEDLALADAGDLTLHGSIAETMVVRVREAVATARGFPMILGGEHTVTVGAVQALAEREPDLGVIVLDAHLDLRDDYEGLRWSHATTVARLADTLGLDRIAVLGARSGTREEWTRAASLALVRSTSAIPGAVWSGLARRPLYLSVDVDAFDPAVAPGTGNPEPLGLSVDDFVTLLSVLREGRVVGCDLVEVSPPCDPSGRTAVLAAWLVREMLVAFLR